MKAKKFIEKYNIKNFADFYAYLTYELRLWGNKKREIYNEPLTTPGTSNEYRMLSLLLIEYGDPRVDIVDDTDGDKGYQWMDIHLNNIRKDFPTFDQKFYERHKKAVDEYIASIPDDYDRRLISFDWHDRSL